MGIVEEVGKDVTAIKAGDRVVIPFQMSCGHCFMCDAKLFSQCETTQVKEQGTGAALFGFSKLYGEVPGGQAEYLRVPQAQTTHIKVPEGPADDRFVYLSDVLPTAWQAVEYAAIPKGGTAVVLGLGPIGDMASRIAQHHGARVLAVDLVPERLQRARDRGIEVIDLTEHEDDLADLVRDQTDGRGPDSVIDAVGMEAHGSPDGEVPPDRDRASCPTLSGRPHQEGGGRPTRRSPVGHRHRASWGNDLGHRRLRRCGRSAPLVTMFDKQIQLRMGQANVLRWIDDIMPLLVDEDPLGVDTFATHHLPLAEAPHAYEIFQKKEDGAVKIVLHP